MKRVKKVLALILALTFVLGISAMGVSAANEVNAKKGETVSVTFTFADAYGINGTISYDNLGLFKSGPVVNVTGQHMEATTEKFFVDNVDATTSTITFTFVVKDDAVAGERCNITLDYVSYDGNGENRVAGSQTAVIVIKEDTTPSQPSQPSQPSVPQIPDSPETGDVTDFVQPSVMMLVAVVAFVAVYSKKKHQA